MTWRRRAAVTWRGGAAETWRGGAAMGCGQNGLWSGNEPMMRYELHPPHTLL